MDQPGNSIESGETPREFVPLDAITRVEKQAGRWVVYLNVPSWESNHADPVANDWKRINDYSSESEANVAATWYQRSANRTKGRPSGF